MKFQSVQVEGKDFPISFGNATYYDLEKETGLKVFNMEGAPFTYVQLMTLYYYAAKHGHRLAGKKFELDLYGFMDVLDDNLTSQISKLMADSQTIEVEEAENGDTKKENQTSK